MFLFLFLLSSSFMYAITPPDYDTLDDEMRAYVKYAAVALQFNPDRFSSHIHHTKNWANQSLFYNGESLFYVVVFDKKFVEEHTKNVRKAIAGHEVGHAYPPCEELFYLYWDGIVSYSTSENCADVVSATIFGYQNMLAALEAIKRGVKDARAIDQRIEKLKEQLGQKDLTPAR